MAALYQQNNCMNKQQAAEAKFPFTEATTLNDKSTLISFRNIFIDGWEAHEALSPNDAVALRKLIIEKVGSIYFPFEDYKSNIPAQAMAVALNEIREICYKTNQNG